ncbi:MAG: ribonucleoside-diphosphate reductase, partial [Buchnera aphidicola]|nr:ribonucleoside-diphosphate reductase [Buchnera aphidicola]
DQSISINTSYNPKNFLNEKIPMKQLLDDLLTAYKLGLKTLYYQNTCDGSIDYHDIAFEIPLEDNCDSGACVI